MRYIPMPAYLSAARWIALTFLTTVSVEAAEQDKPPTEGELRAAITKSLGYLAKGGDEWVEERSCNSCHHMPQLLWNHREAGRRGFPIDAKKLEEWLTWSEHNGTNISAGLEMTAFMKLAMPEHPAPELTKLIVKGQLPDGSWKPAGQFTAQRHGAPEVIENSTRIFLLALAADANDKSTLDESLIKAMALIGKDDPAQSIETLVYRLLFAKRFVKPEAIARLRTEIMKLQHADGGWGWVITEPQSDSIATGLALYALQQSPDPSANDAIIHAERWLINTQQEDGGWPVDITRISKGDRSAPAKAKSLKDATMIYSYWGTGWSTLGLLQALPVTEK